MKGEHVQVCICLKFGVMDWIGEWSFANCSVQAMVTVSCATPVALVFATGCQWMTPGLNMLAGGHHVCLWRPCRVSTSLTQFRNWLATTDTLVCPLFVSETKCWMRDSEYTDCQNSVFPFLFSLKIYIYIFVSWPSIHVACSTIQTKSQIWQIIGKRVDAQKRQLTAELTTTDLRALFQVW